MADLAQQIASEARALYEEVNAFTPDYHRRLDELAAHHGLEFPARLDTHLVHARAIDPRWWSIRLERKRARAAEQANLDCHRVSKQGMPYCSDAALQRVRDRREKFHEAAQGMFAVSDQGDAIRLDQAIESGLANPRNRFADMIMRLRGMEAQAEKTGDRAVFLTITAPSKFHPNSARYEGTTPREAQQYLCRIWSQARASLHRSNLSPYGFRIAEPHTDGTPHWHMILWAPEADLPEVVSIIRDYSMRMDRDEPGASRHRFTAKYLESTASGGRSAVGYLVKYLAKNLDGRTVHGASQGDQLQRDGAVVGDSVEMSERVQAWASTWGIRQFQQIGSAPVGPYRELRRIRDVIADSPQLEALRLAADSADWSAYCELASVSAPTIETRCAALEALRQGDEKGAREALGRYGDPIWRTYAVCTADESERVVTRAVRWTLMTAEEIAETFETAAEATRGLWASILEQVRVLSDALAAPWTSGNNCTHLNHPTGVFA